jgi:hypothetical protein
MGNIELISAVGAAFITLVWGWIHCSCNVVSRQFAVSAHNHLASVSSPFIPSSTKVLLLVSTKWGLAGCRRQQCSSYGIMFTQSSLLGITSCICCTFQIPDFLHSTFIHTFIATYYILVDLITLIIT